MTAVANAKEELAKLVAATPAEDVWTTPAMEAKLRIVALGTELAATGDRETQRFVVEQVGLCKHLATAGDLAFTVVSAETDPDVLRGIAAFFDTAPPTSGLFYAAAQAVFFGNGEEAIAKVAPLFDVEAPDFATLQRLVTITGAMFVARPLRPLIERVLRASVRLDHRNLRDAVSGFPGGPGWEEERAHLLAIDLPPRLVSDLIYRAVVGARGLDRKRLAIVVPLLQAEAAALRDDSAARPRIEAVETVLELPGALLGTAKVKLPKAAAKVALRQEIASEGGPLLAVPKQAVAAWRGVLLPDGKPGVGDFAGTDYGRACAVSDYKSPWGNYGFLDVGGHRGLVLGQRCEVGKRKDGTCLLVMEGDGEGVAALLAAPNAAWKKLAGELELPTGELVLFDAALDKPKPSERAAVKLAPGRYAVDEHEEDGDHAVWIVRLSPLATP